MKVLWWARANGCEWDTITCMGAARNVHLEVLQWAQQKGCHWDEWTCAPAAESGNLKVPQWAWEMDAIPVLWQQRMGTLEY